MMLVFGIFSITCLVLCLPYPRDLGNYQQRQGYYPAIPTQSPQVYHPPSASLRTTVRPKSKIYSAIYSKSKAGLRKRERRRKRVRTKYQKQPMRPQKHQIPTKYQQSNAAKYQYPRQPPTSFPKPPTMHQHMKSKVTSCGPNQIFHKKPRGGFCECKIGFFQLDSASPCIDHDECSTTPGLCGPHATCTNTEGSFTCSCLFGYSGHPPATPCVFDCSHSLAVCGEHAECQHDGECYTCACKPGYCQYHLSTGCVDLDECQQQPGICGPNASCINCDGSYKCECPEGYSIDPLHPALGCQDVDECQDEGRCGGNAECVNCDGSYNCECKQGFHGDPYSRCMDKDECLINPDQCGPHADCVNVEGGFRCSCVQGYQGDPPAEHCCDVDECSEDLYQRSDKAICGPNSICLNIDGSYECECGKGAKGNPPEIPCEDINECLNNFCGPNSICINISPGYLCECPSGYAGNGYDGCYEPIEKHSCNSNSDCTPGAVCKLGTCACQDGYLAQGEACVDIDECQSNHQICGQFSVCTNKLGGYDCHCLPGYATYPPTYHCTQSNNCKRDCGDHSSCVLVEDQFQCQCHQGYRDVPGAGCSRATPDK